MARSRAFRRHQTNTHMWRRLKEDRNQHYNDLTCPCWSDKKAMAKFKEQPKHCSCYMCRSPRKNGGSDRLTVQEKRFAG
jgi:ferredoxin-thioredoxin reductase catalytic subunit